MKLRQLLPWLAAQLLPPACPLCHRTFPSAWEEPFCAACLKDFPPLPEAQCPRCALPYRTFAGSSHLCGRCSLQLPSFSAVHAVGLYEQNLRLAVQLFKFNQRICLDRPLGQLLLRQLPAGSRFDLIVPVPLHPKRLKARSYNQALLLAREVGRCLQVPVVAQLLARVRDAESQRLLSARDRFENMRGMFQLQTPLAGEKILLIDDVMTTGATVSACSLELLRGGANDVQVAVVGRAPIQ